MMLIYFCFVFIGILLHMFLLHIIMLVFHWIYNKLLINKCYIWLNHINRQEARNKVAFNGLLSSDYKTKKKSNAVGSRFLKKDIFYFNNLSTITIIFVIQHYFVDQSIIWIHRNYIMLKLLCLFAHCNKIRNYLTNFINYIKTTCNFGKIYCCNFFLI